MVDGDTEQMKDLRTRGAKISQGKAQIQAQVQAQMGKMGKMGGREYMMGIVFLLRQCSFWTLRGDIRFVDARHAEASRISGTYTLCHVRMRWKVKVDSILWYHQGRHDPKYHTTAKEYRENGLGSLPR